MTSPSDWIAGARPRTFGAAIAPVLLGTAVGAPLRDVHWGFAVLALSVALSLQIGVNYANDYSDGIRGTDDDRVGPMRLVATGRATPAAVRLAAGISLGIAVVLGAWLAALVDWKLLLVGVAAILAAVGYTGGARPYGYRGFGEVVVFLFFGIVATIGSGYVQSLQVTNAAWIASLVVGLPASAVLLANNIRDIATDTQAKKYTLAVRLGPQRARLFFQMMIAVTIASVIALSMTTTWWALLGLLALPLAVMACIGIRAEAPPILIATLVTTVRFELLLAISCATGIWIGSWN